jgi:sulfide:quinone oxidoreductase
MNRGSTTVVIAGGGVAALEAALALRELAGDRVSVELVAPEPHFWYRPLAVAEPFELGEVQRFGLPEVAAAAGATFTPGALVAVDSRQHLVHTGAGGAIPYDALLIACGAIPKPAVPGALTFRGPADTDKVRRMLAELEAGDAKRVVFAVPWGAVWSLPIYELALMTAAHVAARGLRGVELALVTPEDAPLQLFGRVASDAVRKLLDERDIAVHTSTYAAELWRGQLRLVPDGHITADHVVALPRLQGQRIDGVPQTADRFVPVDANGRVHGVVDVFAAGDITSFPVKQGGIAAQQAEAAAEAIAADAGVELAPHAFRPVLRGLLLTGSEPRYLRRELAGGTGETSSADTEPLWWPPAKIVGRYLAPFLHQLAGDEPPDDATAPTGAVPVEVELSAHTLARLAGPSLDVLVRGADDDAEGDRRTVGDVMSTGPLIAAPEDTLGEVAENMREHDVASALVAEYGRLVGILTARDFLRAFAGRVHSSEARAREWMTAEPVTVSARTTVEAAARLMAEHGIHHLPVVEEDRPVGTVVLRDVVRASAPAQLGIGLGF